MRKPTPEEIARAQKYVAIPPAVRGPKHREYLDRFMASVSPDEGMDATTHAAELSEMPDAFAVYSQLLREREAARQEAHYRLADASPDDVDARAAELLRGDTPPRRSLDDYGIDKDKDPGGRAAIKAGVGRGASDEQIGRHLDARDTGARWGGYVRKAAWTSVALAGTVAAGAMALTGHRARQAAEETGDKVADIQKGVGKFADESGADPHGALIPRSGSKEMKAAASKDKEGKQR